MVFVVGGFLFIWQGGCQAETLGQSDRVSQQEKAFKLFRQIFEMSSGVERAVNFSRMQELYQQIIVECPDAPLAQESYLRLITMAFESEPPQTKNALSLFERFKKKYPNSPLMNSIRSTLTKLLYGTQAWQELLDMESPLVEQYFVSGKIASPVSIFYYAEANYHLQAYSEAAKGYRAIIDNYGETRMAPIAALRMDKIKMKGIVL